MNMRHEGLSPYYGEYKCVNRTDVGDSTPRILLAEREFAGGYVP
jgi:hypothetical protein